MSQLLTGVILAVCQTSGVCNLLLALNDASPTRFVQCGLGLIDQAGALQDIHTPWSRRSQARRAHLPVQLPDQSRRRGLRRAGGGSRHFVRRLLLRLLHRLPLEGRTRLLSLREEYGCSSENPSQSMVHA